MKNKFLLFLLLISTASLAQISGPSWIKSELTKSEVFDSPLYEFTNKYDQYKSHENISGLLIKGLDYLGKPTQFFAWYGVPTSLKEGQKAPAVICVHGGGGTAFEDWVQKWNDRGYIAISMSLEGNVPGPKDENNKHPKFEFSGPQRDGFFKDADKDLQDQWFYHAVADVILTNSLLRDPNFSSQIDTSAIGITGISWGGILTNVITGIDNRYHFAIPVYGCGYLNEAPLYINQLSNNTSNQQHFYLENWEPSLYVPSQSQATLHVNGTNDKHFSLNSFTKTYSATQSEKYLSIELNMKHGHQAGWMPEDIYQFADYMTKTGNKRAAFVSEDLDANNQLSYKYEYEGRLDRAYLYYTKDTADWSQSEYSWTEQEATVSYEEKKIITTLPSDAVAYFVNAISTDELIFSSPMKVGTDNIAKNQEHDNDRSKYYPEFSWETVPVAFHFGKTSALMTEEEAKFVASKSNFICLEKAHALDQLGSTEEGIEQEARQLKKYNPKMKVIFYWNTFLDYSMFDAHKVYEQHPEWWLKTQDGKLDLKNGKLKRYDLSNHDVRAWWTYYFQIKSVEKHP